MKQSKSQIQEILANSQLEKNIGLLRKIKYSNSLQMMLQFSVFSLQKTCKFANINATFQTI